MFAGYYAILQTNTKELGSHLRDSGQSEQAESSGYIYCISHPVDQYYHTAV